MNIFSSFLNKDKKSSIILLKSVELTDFFTCFVLLMTTANKKVSVNFNGIKDECLESISYDENNISIEKVNEYLLNIYINSSDVRKKEFELDILKNETMVTNMYNQYINSKQKTINFDNNVYSLDDFENLVNKYKEKNILSVDRLIKLEKNELDLIGLIKKYEISEYDKFLEIEVNKEDILSFNNDLNKLKELDVNLSELFIFSEICDKYETHIDSKYVKYINYWLTFEGSFESFKINFDEYLIYINIFEKLYDSCELKNFDIEFYRNNKEEIDEIVSRKMNFLNRIKYNDILNKELIDNRTLASGTISAMEIRDVFEYNLSKQFIKAMNEEYEIISLLKIREIKEACDIYMICIPSGRTAGDTSAGRFTQARSQALPQRTGPGPQGD